MALNLKSHQEDKDSHEDKDSVLNFRLLTPLPPPYSFSQRFGKSGMTSPFSIL